MTLWTERFRTHDLWAQVGRAREGVNAIKIDAADVRGQEILAYAGAAIELLEQRRTESSALEVTPTMLDTTRSAVSDWVTYLEYVVNGVYGADQLLTSTDAVLTSLSSWPPLKPARYLSGIAQSVDSFAGRISEVLKEFDETAVALRKQLSVLSEERNQLAAEVANEEQRVRESLARFESTSAEEFQHIRESQQELLDEQLAGWQNEEESFRGNARALIESLEGHEVTARETVHAVTASTVANDYGKYARNKSVAAWLCDVAAALVGAAGVAAILIHLFTIDPNGDSNVGLSLTRLAASLGTLGIAGLVAHRGAQHHKEARAAKRTDLALRKVGPFIVDLPKDEQQLIVQTFTDRVFIRGELDGDVTAGEPLAEKLRSLRDGRSKEAS